jgi:hypothetical protein
MGLTSYLRRGIRVTLTSLALFGTTATVSLAQRADDAPPPPLPAGPAPIALERLLVAPDLGEPDEAELAELGRWMDEFTEWQTWAAEWRNRRERGWFTPFRDRREKPPPPAWLSKRCETVFDNTDSLKPACVLLAEWNDDAAPGSQLARAAATAQTEQHDRVVWWEHVHMEVLWPALQWQSSVYGVIGLHTTTTVRGRWQIFLAPGAMLLNLPARDGGRVWKIAANYGVGYRLFEFAFPGGREAVLHVNAAKAYLLSDPTDVVTGRTMDFAGFSITFKRAR